MNVYAMARHAVAALALCALSVSAHAVIIDLSATTTGDGPNDINNAITFDVLETDIITVEVIGTADGGVYNAWNPWGRTAGCNGQGMECGNGWVNNFSYFVNGDTGTATTLTDGDRYLDPLDALANAVNPEPITGVTSISFFINDNPFTDNDGGISLSVTITPGEPGEQPTGTVPEPGPLLLIGLGLIALAVRRRRAF